jgi:DNA polymerase/3'-5' exonuclease PolX
MRFPAHLARAVADELVAELRPACSRIEVAGSLRRGLASVKDIEIVAEPTLARTLFDLPDVHQRRTQLDELLERLLRECRLSQRLFRRGAADLPRWGDRYKAAIAEPSGIPIDLFLVRPPASWGAILAIRTGPEELSRRLVTVCRERGLRLVDGRLVDERGDRVDTPTERDFFAACGVAWLEPDERG